MILFMTKLRPGPVALLTFALWGLAACASAPRTEAQWTDPALTVQSRFLQGQKVLIACEAYDIAAQRICEDLLSREVVAAGATPLRVPAGTVVLNDRELDGQLVAPALAAGAKGVLVITLTAATVSAGSGVSIGIGGFSFGRGGGAGIGVSAPLGGGPPETGFAANGRLTDVARSRLIWTATTTAQPSADPGAQFSGLVGSLLDSARKSGVF